MGAGYPCQQPRNVSTLPRLRPAAASAQSRTRDADAQSRSARVRWRQFRRPGAMQRVRSGLSRRVGGCVIMILLGAIFAYGWHGDDRRALRMAEAVMAHRAIDKPADAHMFVRPDYEQRCSDRFGQQHWPRLAGGELQPPVGFWMDGVEYGHDRFPASGIHCGGVHRHSHAAHPELHVEVRRYVDRVYGAQALSRRSRMFGRPDEGRACRRGHIQADPGV
jgi:hypothetical protein